jgi:hypothetical protein
MRHRAPALRRYVVTDNVPAGVDKILRKRTTHNAEADNADDTPFPCSHPSPRHCLVEARRYGIARPARKRLSHTALIA